jgi:hypothetical protein
MILSILVVVVIGSILILLLRTSRRSCARGPHTLTIAFRDGSQEVLVAKTDCDLEERIDDRLCDRKVASVEYHRGGDGFRHIWLAGYGLYVSIPPMSQRRQ